MPIATILHRRGCAIATTLEGLRCLAPVCQTLNANLWISDSLATAANTLDIPHQSYDHSLRDFLAQRWHTYDSFIFCLATGAVVRLIAPLLQDKATDPAVVVIDAAGQYAISLCGGHQGGADHLAQQVSHCLDAKPIITGAAYHRGLSGIDIMGTPFGWVKGSGAWTGVSAAIANSAPVQIIQDCGSDLWQQSLPEDHAFQFGFPEFQDRDQDLTPQARIWISSIQRQFADNGDLPKGLPKVQWHPRVLWVGIGCERGSPQALIEYALEQVFRKNHLALGAIAGVATLDIKADEVGLVELCQDRDWPLRCFKAAQLKDIAVPNPSKVVETAVGTGSVAEAAAILVASLPATAIEGPPAPQFGGVLRTGIDSPASRALKSMDSKSPSIGGFRGPQNGVQKKSAPIVTALRVPKQIIRHPDYIGAVTVAIAQAETEYTGRTGELLLVGTGPGSLDQITPAAKTAINRADVVIGYTLYVDLIRPLLRPGQIIEALPITQEKQRAERATALANWGLTVAVISSGDCGIYGMGGLVLETLKTQNWDGKTPAVQIFPGISALQSAASRVGAPLMHDFCAISLSDLLTPWEVIQKRLVAAAQADFIVALYNPKSKTRTEQIQFAQQTLLQYRQPDTPVALARSLYRPDEQIVLTTLGDMLNHPIDMLTTVLIGNQSSLTHTGWFITPRGYLGFKQLE
ncbi:MAG: precorrin-3B C(17)-methyltransferase [Cyanobacteria bacterium J06635_1]